nr:hypothetical protein CFP56_68187 [Quercus suber]
MVLKPLVMFYGAVDVRRIFGNWDIDDGALTLVVTIAWEMWSNRNNKRHGGKVEAKAFEEGLLFAHDIGIREIILQKGDSLLIENCIAGKSSPPAFFYSFCSAWEIDDGALTLVVIIAWEMWSNRNNKRHGGKVKTNQAVIERSANYIREYQTASQ